MDVSMGEREGHFYIYIYLPHPLFYSTPHPLFPSYSLLFFQRRGRGGVTGGRRAGSGGVARRRSRSRGGSIAGRERCGGRMRKSGTEEPRRSGIADGGAAAQAAVSRARSGAAVAG